MKRKSLITLLVLLSAGIACTNSFATTLCGSQRLYNGNSCLVIQTSDRQGVNNISLKKSIIGYLSTPGQMPDRYDDGLKPKSSEISYFNDFKGDFSYGDRHYEFTKFGITLSSAYINNHQVPLSNCKISLGKNQLNALHSYDNSGKPHNKQFGFRFFLGTNGNLTCKAVASEENTKCNHEIQFVSSTTLLGENGENDADGDFDPNGRSTCMYIQNNTDKVIFEGALSLNIEGNVTFNAITVTPDLPYYKRFYASLYKGKIKVNYALQSADGKPVSGCTLDLTTDQKQKAMVGKVIIFNVSNQAGTYTCQKIVKNAADTITAGMKKHANTHLVKFSSKPHTAFSLINKLLK